MIRLGRFSPAQAAAFGSNLVRGCGYIAVGPVALIFNLPRRLERADPEVSLFDLNAHLRERARASADLLGD